MGEDWRVGHHFRIMWCTCIGFNVSLKCVYGYTTI